MENSPEYRKQARAGKDATNQMAPFLERRQFYLKGKLCYKGMQCV
jgi:hypothetical protein